MTENIFEDLKQLPFYRYFSQISAIPRGSGNEKAISDYIVGFAKDHHLTWKQDDHFNVMIRKDGSAGYEASESIVLQCHMDMVCEKTVGSSHDFTKDPIIITDQDGFLKAEETSLGADDGVGMAYILAILSDPNLTHPPIEALFTTGEEIGLVGMANLDGEWITSKRMMNLDGEEEGILYTSCAGGARYYIQKMLEFHPLKENKVGYRIALENLCGGHSGIDIDKGRGNSIILLGRLLAELKAEDFIQVSDISGGTKTNAIPRDAYAYIWISSDQETRISNYVEDFKQRIKKEYGEKELHMTVTLDMVSAEEQNVFEVLDERSLDCILDFLLLLPNGALGYSPHLAGVLESSSNLGMMSIIDGNLTIAGLVRANNNSKLDDTLLRIRRLTARLEGELEERNRYPAWEYQEDSKLRELSAKVYQELFHREIVTESIHGGLECALMFEKKNEMDMISLGSNLFDVHTVNERADIASMIRTWKYVVKLLESLCC